MKLCLGDSFSRYRYESQWPINHRMNKTPTRSKPHGVVNQVGGRLFSGAMSFS